VTLSGHLRLQCVEHTHKEHPLGDTIGSLYWAGYAEALKFRLANERTQPSSHTTSHEARWVVLEAQPHSSL